MVFSYEYSEVFKNTFFAEHLRAATFGKATTEFMFQISFSNVSCFINIFESYRQHRFYGPTLDDRF